MANDTRGNRQFSWLRQLAYRRDLLRQCSGVAIALTKYFNSEEDEWARPAIQRIADDLGISLNAAP